MNMLQIKSKYNEGMVFGRTITVDEDRGHHGPRTRIGGLRLSGTMFTIFSECIQMGSYKAYPLAGANTIKWLKRWRSLQQKTRSGDLAESLVGLQTLFTHPPAYIVQELVVHLVPAERLVEAVDYPMPRTLLGLGQYKAMARHTSSGDYIDELEVLAMRLMRRIAQARKHDAPWVVGLYEETHRALLPDTLVDLLDL